MGAYDLILHASQSARIGELEDRVEKLEKQNEILYEWIQYFRTKEAENDTKS